MRFFSLLTVGAAVVAPVVADFNTIVADFSLIQNQTETLTQKLNNFGGAKDSLVILTSVAGLTKVVQQATADAKATSNFTINQAAQLAGPVGNLATAVNASIVATINQYFPLVNAGLGPETERQLLKIQSSSGGFTNAVLALVPESLQSFAQGLSAPITASLEAGVKQFEGTTIPNNVSYSSGAESFSAPAGAMAYGAVLIAALAAF